MKNRPQHFQHQLSEDAPQFRFPVKRQFAKIIMQRHTAILCLVRIECLFALQGLIDKAHHILKRYIAILKPY